MSNVLTNGGRKRSIATIKEAIDQGITLFDTGDFYGSGHNELLLAEGLGNKTNDVFIQVKFGMLRDPSGDFIGADLHPSSIKNYLSMSLQRLQRNKIDLYQPARLTAAFEVETVMETLAEAVDKGWIDHIGLSEAGVASIDRAVDVHAVTSLQIEYSMITRTIEKEILPFARRQGITINAYGVLSRGLLSGGWSEERAESNPRDYRTRLPRFTGENFTHNMQIVRFLSSIADELEATNSQVAIAWSLNQGDDIVPIIGAKTPERLEENIRAIDIKLDNDQMMQINEFVERVQVKGTRYDEHMMKLLDSEK